MQDTEVETEMEMGMEVEDGTKVEKEEMDMIEEEVESKMEMEVEEVKRSIEEEEVAMDTIEGPKDSRARMEAIRVHDKNMIVSVSAKSNLMPTVSHPRPPRESAPTDTPRDHTSDATEPHDNIESGEQNGDNLQCSRRSQLKWN